MSISTPPGWDASPLQGYANIIFTGTLRHYPHSTLLVDNTYIHTAVKRGARAQFPKFFAFNPKVKTVAEKLSFKLRIWPGNLVMEILKYSQLVIFSHSTFFYNVFLQKSCRFSLQVRGCENRKWRWIFTFDRCVTYTNVCFWETAHLPLPKPNFNTYFSRWAKC